MNGRTERVDFIRRTLGCTCPDEVLARISERWEEGNIRVLDVGGRLLVHILRPARNANLEDELGAWLERGRRQRDAEGFNRFRLVLVGDEPQAVRERLEPLFAKLAAADGRMHLHVVEPRQLPATVTA